MQGVLLSELWTELFETLAMRELSKMGLVFTASLVFGDFETLDTLALLPPCLLLLTEEMAFWKTLPLSSGLFSF